MYISPISALGCGLIILAAAALTYYERRTAPQRARALIQKRLCLLIDDKSFEPMNFPEICEVIGTTALEPRRVAFEELDALVNKGLVIVRTISDNPKKYYCKP